MVAVILSILWAYSVCTCHWCECIACVISLGFQSGPVGVWSGGKQGAVICSGRMVLEQSRPVTQRCRL